MATNRTEYVSLGPIFLGKLLSWDGVPGVRFIFRQKPSVTLGGTAVVEPISQEFESRVAFDAWLASLSKTSAVEAA